MITYLISKYIVKDKYDVFILIYTLAVDLAIIALIGQQLYNRW